VCPSTRLTAAIIRTVSETKDLPAEVTALYKKGSKSDRGNYRPVSLTSVCCKILEQLIRDDGLFAW